MFSPGIDAIDLDRDGVAGPDETAARIEVEMRDLTFKQFSSRSSFDATADYVFLDTNGNNTRDFGAGFTEKTPAFGEPIFVPDDANGNGVLDPGERLLRLGTTKFAKINADGLVYERGAKSSGIIDYGIALLENLSRARSPEHGTYCSAIMAGGNGSNRWRGIAPGADIVVVTTPDLSSLDWLAREPGITAVSMPFGSWSFALDGSSPLESIVDALWARGVVASVAIGNSGAGAGHRTVTLTPSVPTTVMLNNTFASHGAIVNALVRAPGASVDVTMTESANAPLDVDAASDVSPRGTATTLLRVSAPKGFGTLALTLTLKGTSAPATVHLYATGSYGQELAFTEGGSPASTMTSPATADTNLGATGYVLHSGTPYGTEQAVGALASFASQGPRVDGRALSGLATPVNPIAATIVKTGVRHVAMRAWPGTSTGAPQIAAAAALIKQRTPSLDAQAIRAKLLAGAQHDANTTNANAWGAGRLDVRAAAGLPELSKAPPVVRLDVVDGATRRLHVDVGAADRATLKARWDLDYDGAWDTDWVALDDVDAPTGDAPTAVRVDVHDDAGNVVGATATVSPTASSARAPDGEDGHQPSDGCAISSTSSSGSHLPPLLFLTVALSFWRRRR